MVVIPDIGDIVANSVVDFFSYPENQSMIQRLFAAGVHPVWRQNGLSAALQGKTVVVTGTLPTLSRDEAERMITAHGGKAAGTVSKKTSFVVVGEKAGRKLTKATELGIPIYDEETFLKLFQTE